MDREPLLTIPAVPNTPQRTLLHGNQALALGLSPEAAVLWQHIP